MFNPLGVSLEQAVDGVEALERVRARRAEGLYFDAVIVDNQMQRMHGAQLVRELRLDGFDGLIVGLTGDIAGSADRLAFEESGMDVCFDKHQQGLVELQQLLKEHRDGTLALARTGQRCQS